MPAAVEQDVLVDLVGVDADVPRCLREDHLRNRLELRARSDAPGGVRREVQDDQLGARRDERREVLAGERKALLLVEVQRDRLEAEVAGERLVDREARARVDHLVAGVAVHLLAEADRRLAAGKHHHPVRRDVETTPRAHFGRDGFAERQDALRVHVVGHVGVELPLDLVPDVGRQREVGLAEIAADDLETGRGHLVDVRTDLERVLGADPLHSCRIERHGRPLQGHRMAKGIPTQGAAGISYCT